MAAFILLATATLLGTLAMPLSSLLFHQSILVGPAFYNYTLIPIALVLLAGMAAWASMATASLPAIVVNRRTVAILVVHLAFVAMVVGVSGSSWGTRRHEVTMRRGETIHWAGRQVCFRSLNQRDLADKFVVEAKLEVSDGSGTPYVLLPARLFYRSQNQWSTRVAVHSTWGSDFYGILQGGTGENQITLSLIENPLMRWLWLGGGMAVAAALLLAWPNRRRAASSAGLRSIGEPHFLATTPVGDTRHGH